MGNATERRLAGDPLNDPVLLPDPASTTFALNGQRTAAGRISAINRACPAALMHQEQSFLHILASAHHFGVFASGALVLEGADAGVIVAWRR